MIDESEVVAILKFHDDWVLDRRPKWDNFRAAYKDEFWDKFRLDTTTERHGRTGVETSPIRVESNLVRFNIDAIVAGLFYKGLRTVVRQDEAVLGEAQKQIGGFEPGQVQSAIASLIDRFLNVQNADILSEQAFVMALLYPEVGLKLGIDESADNVLERVWLDALPPWECVWDRKNRNQRDMRYIGHVYWMSKEEFEERFGVVEGANYRALPDVVADGIAPITSTVIEEPKTWVRVFEFNDLTEAHRAADGKQSAGEFRVYLVDTADQAPVLKELAKEAMPYTWTDGRPAPNILPLVLISVPEFPLQGIPFAAAIYEVAKERNVVTTILANAFRRDAARVLLLLKEAFDEEAIADILSGKDGVVVEVEHDTLLNIAQWLQQQPISPTILQYLQVLNQNQQDTHGTAEFTRGKSLNYATATEILRLNDYTETTLGRLRKKMDKAIQKLAALFLRVLREAAGGETFEIRVGKDVVELDPDLLDLRWEITLTDIANTPIAESQRRGDFGQVQPILLQLIEVATLPASPPAMAKMAQEQLDYLIQIYDLPESMGWKQLSLVHEEAVAEQQVAEAEQAPAPGAPLSPEDEIALLQQLDTESLLQLKQAAGGGL